MQHARESAFGNRVIAPARPTGRPAAKSLYQSRLRKTKLLSIMATCFMLSVFVIAQYSSLIILNYRLTGMRSDIAAVKEKTRVIELEAAKLAAIGRIEEIARDDLGMIEPKADQLRILTAHQGDANRLGE